MDNTFGKRLEYMIQKRKLSQRQFSEMSGITEQSISRYIKGTRIPRVSELIKIADTLDTSIDYLMGRVDVTVDDIIEELVKVAEDANLDITMCLHYNAASLIIKQTYEKLKQSRR